MRKRLSSLEDAKRRAVAAEDYHLAAQAKEAIDALKKAQFGPAQDPHLGPVVDSCPPPPRPAVATEPGPVDSEGNSNHETPSQLKRNPFARIVRKSC